MQCLHFLCISGGFLLVSPARQQMPSKNASKMHVKKQACIDSEPGLMACLDGQMCHGFIQLVFEIWNTSGIILSFTIGAPDLHSIDGFPFPLTCMGKRGSDMNKRQFSKNHLPDQIVTNLLWIYMQEKMWNICFRKSVGMESFCKWMLTCDCEFGLICGHQSKYLLFKKECVTKYNFLKQINIKVSRQNWKKQSIWRSLCLFNIKLTFSTIFPRYL